MLTSGFRLTWLVRYGISQVNHLRTKKIWMFIYFGGLGLGLVLLNSACQEASVSCLSDLQCDQESVCIAGQCLGAELEDRDPELYYAEEMHYRLVAECGICHAATAVSEEVPPPIDMMELDERDPYKLPKYTTQLGDSGWRIYIDDLTPERLRASYLETMQFINLKAPEESLLLAFGRGEVGISQYQRHPKLYTTRDELELGQKAPIGYERLLNWAKLPHLDSEVITYNLQNYLDGPQMIIAQRCAGCHEGNPILSDSDTVLPRGGFAFRSAPNDTADLSPLSALINIEQPENSALIRLLIGEYDHPNYAGEEEGLEALKNEILPWIEGLR